MARQGSAIKAVPPPVPLASLPMAPAPVAPSPVAAVSAVVNTPPPVSVVTSLHVDSVPQHSPTALAPAPVMVSSGVAAGAPTTAGPLSSPDQTQSNLAVAVSPMVTVQSVATAVATTNVAIAASGHTSHDEISDILAGPVDPGLNVQLGDPVIPPQHAGGDTGTFNGAEAGGSITGFSNQTVGMVVLLAIVVWLVMR